MYVADWSDARLKVCVEELRDNLSLPCWKGPQAACTLHGLARGACWPNYIADPFSPVVAWAVKATSRLYGVQQLERCGNLHK